MRVPPLASAPRAAAVGAGVVYAASVFAAGFLLGAVRILAITPRWGAITGVLVELPIILALAWMLCGVWVRRFGVRGPRAGLIMGVTAFLVLQAAEFAMTITLFGGTLADFVAGIATPAGAVGMAGEVVFGVFPLIRAVDARRTELWRPV